MTLRLSSIGSSVRHVLCAMLAASCMLASTGISARTSDVNAGSLPREARETLELIRSDGPFPYSRDGIVFGNRERILPSRPRGYYREYTVRMPGSRGRGAHRIVCGGEQRLLRDCYYSDDHYLSFRRIR